MNTVVDTIDSAGATNELVAVQLTILGRVQGVGLRPTIARLAAQLALAGHVCNTPAGVVAVLEGPRHVTESFLQSLRERLPPEADVRDIRCNHIAPSARTSFEVLPGTEAGSIQTQVPRDFAACPHCLADVSDTSNRRHGYAFTTCTDCGPRYSIIHAIPFERSQTAMQGFAPCSACRGEYASPDDRRFHAQTIACPRCGPQCWMVDSDGTLVAQGSAAIGSAAAALRDGRIVALKGLGGYQLLADATNPAAVIRLRHRKQRPIKPLAVMVASLDVAQTVAQLDEVARESMTSRAGPIVIVPARAGVLAGEVNPGLDCVGLLLPTTPLHWLLARQCPPLVATSGNRDGEPLAWEEMDAECRLAGIADCFLHHNRPIHRPVDDSVVRIIAGRPVTIRAGRGVAPLQLELLAGLSTVADAPHIIAVGGHQKVAIALFNGCQAALGPHVGDLDELSTRDHLASHIQNLCQLYDVKPSLIVHDAHPDYYSTRWATNSGLRTMAVQHHHAHIVAAMVENGWHDRKVLGVAWDGTGHGPDGTVWGGEFLRTTASCFRRVARLRPFPLLSGEAAIREPWRAALAVLRDAIGTNAAVELLTERGFDRQIQERLLMVADRSSHVLLTSSAGRLFDAVAAWLLPLEAAVRCRAPYEGYLAMLLEACCGTEGCESGASDLPAQYRVPIVPGEPNELDWRPVVAALVADFRRGLAASLLAARFHAALADAIVRTAELDRNLPVVLGGGVFQNRLLTEMVARRMASSPQPLGLLGAIPPNDGGLAAGQLAVAIARLSSPS
jgi:hydrogenase maturation protein HypF